MKLLNSLFLVIQMKQSRKDFGDLALRRDLRSYKNVRWGKE